MSKLADTIRSLTWAAPFVLAARKPTSMAACYDMSFAGSEVLCRLGFDAKPLPCVLLGQSPDRSTGLALGLTVDEARERAGGGGELLDDANGDGHHVAIEVKHRGARAFIDLTIGQIRRYGVPTTWTVWFFCPGWPAFEMEGWRLQYEPSPRPADALARTVQYRDKLAGMANDLEELTRAARQCRDYDQFFESLRFSTEPRLWASMMTTMESWEQLGTLPA